MVKILVKIYFSDFIIYKTLRKQNSLTLGRLDLSWCHFLLINLMISTCNLIPVYHGLDKKVSEKLDKHITEREVTQVLKDTKNNKSVMAVLVLLSNFIFFEWLKYFITIAINDLFIQKQLPISQRLDII